VASSRHKGARRKKTRVVSWKSLAVNAALPVAGTVLVVSAAGAAAISPPPVSVTAVASAGTTIVSSPFEALSVSRDLVRTEEGLELESKIARPEASSEGTKYVLSNVEVRTSPSDDAERVATFRVGSEITVTGQTVDGYTQVLNKGLERWVKTSTLGDERPFGSVSCPRGSDIEKRFKPAAVKTYRAVCQAFPQITTYGGWAGRNDHAKGQAVDIMVTGALGDKIAQFLMDHRKELGVHYIIWKQRYWSVRNPSWKAMADRGSKTANHWDHVHVSTFVDPGD